MPSTHATLAVIVLAFCASLLLFDISGSPPQQRGPIVVTPQQGQPDLTSLMQGVPRVDLLSLADKDKAAGAAPKQSKAKVEIPDTASPGEHAVGSSFKAETHPSDVAVRSRRGEEIPDAISAASRFSRMRLALQAATVRLGESANVTSSSAGIAIVLLVVLIVCTCLAACSIVFPMPFGSDSRRNANAPPQGAKDPATVLEQRDRMLVNSSVSMASPVSANVVPADRGYQRSSPLGSQMPMGQLASPMLDTRTPRSLEALPSQQVDAVVPPSKKQLPHAVTRESLPPSDLVTPTIDPRAKPPPLCPSLVMPANEARLGIPMVELAQVNSEGRLNIIGITGKPLLRATINKIGAARSLEISMPEQNTVPRATIQPAALSVDGEHERAMEIRGVRGVFYGILEMRSSGACYVVKDGQTVLTIDGDAESLQLAIKSGVGLTLASVRCSAELFEGVDHVEIRVEPGVDTVLVIGVVLSVLLLSPYLPPTED